MQVTADGGFIFAESPDLDGDIFIQKTDAAGNFVWANQISMPGNQTPGRVIENADGSFAVGGISNTSLLLVKTDELGKTGCNDNTVTINNTNPLNTVHDATLYYNTSVALAATELGNISTDRVFTPATVCMNDPCQPVEGSGPMLCGRNEAVVKEIENYHEDTPCDDLLQFSTSRGMEQYKVYTEKLLGDFTASYIAECLKAVDNEVFTVQQTVSEYHYTLYYYDQAGNLLKTVPPAGVNANYTQNWFDQVAAARAAHAALPSVHSLVTEYRYNTLNQVITQKTPDAGTSEFWYDRLGRLAISQNAKQKAESNNYSYTKYDYLGRITEVGQINTPTTSMADATSRFPKVLDQWFTDNAAKRQQITQTQYDLPGKDLSLFITINARTLRNRVAFTSFTAANNTVAYNAATYYNYDIHGNVSSLLQDYGGTGIIFTAGQQYKRIDYQYDLISGKVNEVAYQNGYKDQFFHRYTYDAENRLTAAYTSADYVRWEQDANYQYYKHGPLARTELGQQHVQGLDYAYTLQGWLKGVNGTVLSATGGGTDMGGDGNANNLTRAQDVYGYSLHYNDADYRAIGKPSWFTGLKTPLQAAGDYRPLFNGNIGSMAVNIPVAGGVRGSAPMVYNYSYDQLNRLISMDAFAGNNTGNQLWENGLSFNGNWQEQITYDANGNIKTYRRNGDGRSSTSGMDKLKYVYKPNSNQLLQVIDSVTTALPADYNDIKTQVPNNYDYDAVGNMIKDGSANITTIQWTVYGKISSIIKSDGSKINYTYDAAGNRISKTLVPPAGGAGVTTWYVRDASGNTMAVYGIGDNTVNAGRVTLRERHLYGSGRLGILNPNLDISAGILLPYQTALINTTTKTFSSIFTRGQKFFELSNHLGNVLVTISDKKIGHDAGTGTIDYYNADVASANDYAPFGMQTVGKTYTSTLGASYRYGFGGQEKSNEIKGEGNSYTAEFWEYDPRTGRRWNLDPKPSVGISQYSAFSNNPIWFSDPKGDTLSDPQMVDALKLASNEVKSRLRSNKPFYKDDRTRNLGKAITAYGEANKLSYADLTDFYKAAHQYYNGLATLAEVSTYDFLQLDNQVINGKSGNAKSIVMTSEFFMHKGSKEFGTVWTEAYKRTLETVFAAGLPMSAGKGTRGVLITSETQQALVNAGYRQSFIGDYWLLSKSNFSSGVFRKEIWGLAYAGEQKAGGASILRVLNSIETEARAAGAQSLIIQGKQVVNEALLGLSSKTAATLGYDLQKVGSDVITLTKKL